MSSPPTIQRLRREIRDLAGNLPYRRIVAAELDAPGFEPESVRQPRTFVRIEPGMQAIGRFLVERGTVEILAAPQVRALFTEIQWCVHRVHRLANARHRSAVRWREAVVEARRCVSRMEAAEEELFIANRRLVVSCVKPFFWIGQVWMGDFLQEGSKALANAIRKFDYTRGTPFYAYAQKAIQNRLRNYFRDHVRSGHIGVRPTLEMVRVKGLMDAWKEAHGKEPDTDTLARLADVPRPRAQQLGHLVRQWENLPAPPVSLDALLGDTTASLHDLIEDTGAELISERAQIGEIWTAIERLPERSRRIMRMRFIEGRTLEETGQEIGLTRARIKQIQDDALRRLRAMLLGKAKGG